MKNEKQKLMFNASKNLDNRVKKNLISISNQHNLSKISG